MNAIIPSDTEQQKDVLWKKYLTKKKSFAKAQLQLSEYQKIVKPAFDRWFMDFAGDRFCECMMIRHELKKYDDDLLEFTRLCRMLKKSPSDVLFLVQKECIAQNKFFWGIVRDLSEKASAETEQRFREHLKAMMGDNSGENTKRLWESFERLNNATDPGRRKLSIPPAEPEKPEQMGELKKLYRTLCLRHHPDKTGFYNEKLWLEIQDAYEKGSVKKLRELMKRPVAKANETSFGLSCEEILAMTEALEKEFKPVRADLRMAKKSPAWDFTKWDAMKRDERKNDLSAQADESLDRLQKQLEGQKAEVRKIFKGNSKFKSVQIMVTLDAGKKATYTIRMIYGVHEKTLSIRRAPKQSDAQFAERCAVEGLCALKSPCRVSFILPVNLRAVLRPVEPGFIFGDDLGNLVSRHIVTFVASDSVNLPEIKNIERRNERMATNKKIYAFATKWIGIFQANHISQAEAEMGDECKALGFIMDCGKEMNRHYPEAMSSVEKLWENLEQINNIKVLGSGIYSQWRYYQHWAESPWDTEWFILALQRLVDLTKDEE